MDIKSFIRNYGQYYWILYVILFLVTLVIHLRFPFIGDDLEYYSIKPFTENSGFLDFITYRTMEWTSRTLIETTLYGLFTLPYLVWRVLDTFVFTGIAVLMYKIVSNAKDNKSKLIYSLISCILTFLFFVTLIPSLKSAGYAASTVNYIWPFFALLLHFYLVKYILNNKIASKAKKVLVYAVMILSLIYGINHEQVAALTFGIYFFTILYLLKTKKPIPRILYINIIIVMLGLAYIFLNSGNYNRIEVQSEAFFPDYGQLTLYDKINISVFNILNYFVSCSEIFTLFTFYHWFDHPLIYRLLCIDTITLYLLLILGVYAYKFRKSWFKTFICFIPFFISLFFAVLVATQNGFLIEMLVSNVTKYGYHPIGMENLIISLGIYVVFILCFVYSLYHLYSSLKGSEKGKKIALAVIMLIFLGICTTLTYGFTPSWVALPRMCIYFYACNFISGVILTIYLFKQSRISQYF